MFRGMLGFLASHVLVEVVVVEIWCYHRGAENEVSEAQSLKGFRRMAEI
jgi:hypothetical protein